VIRALGDLGQFIRGRSQYAVGGVLSPADYLSTTRFMVRNTDPEARRLPDDPMEIKLLWDYYSLARGPQRLRQVVDTNYWRSLTTVFLKGANFVDTAKLMRDIRDYEREQLAPRGISLNFAGDVAASQSLIKGIVNTQMHSLLWSLAGIYIVTALLGGSVRWGLYCVVPSLLAVVLKLAIMGWFEVPLGIATSMFAAMTLGIGVNCAIQFLESHRQALGKSTSPLEVLSRAMALTGPPALINTIAVSLGFGVLMLSQVPANARLGLLVVLGLVECLAASLLMLPVLLYWWPGRPSSGVTKPTGKALISDVHVETNLPEDP
jgi:predicted RND superfamily exporter protein